MAENDSDGDVNREEEPPHPAIRYLGEDTGGAGDETMDEAERVRDDAAAEARAAETEREAKRQNIEGGGAAEETANPDGHRDEPPFSS